MLTAATLASKLTEVILHGVFVLVALDLYLVYLRYGRDDVSEISASGDSTTQKQQRNLEHVTAPETHRSELMFKYKAIS